MIELQFDGNPALEIDRAASLFQLGLLAFHLNEPKIELFLPHIGFCLCLLFGHTWVLVVRCLRTIKNNFFLIRLFHRML